MNAAHLHRLAKRLGPAGRAVEYLIFLLYNSVVPTSVTLGQGTILSYGGIGVVLHKRTVMGRGCVIGQGVTVGSSVGYVTDAETECPTIGDNVYLGAGAKVLGAITVGSNSVVAANAVVIHDVPAGSVVAGVPARVVGTTEPGYRAIRRQGH